MLPPRLVFGLQVVVQEAVVLNRHRWGFLAENILSCWMENMGVLQPSLFYINFRISSVKYPIDAP